MQQTTASFYRGEEEVLRDIDIKFEEVLDPGTSSKTWYGEFYLNHEPKFESGHLRLSLSDGRSRDVRVIVTNFMKYFFVTFRSLTEEVETARQGSAEEREILSP